MFRMPNPEASQRRPAIRLRQGFAGGMTGRRDDRRFNFQTAATTVIASASEAIHRSGAGKEWIASSLSLLAMTRIHFRILAGALRPRFARISLPPIQRAQGMPGAQRARSLACKIKKHTSIVTTDAAGFTQHSPHNGFNGSSVLSPATGLFATNTPAKIHLEKRRIFSI